MQSAALSNVAQLWKAWTPFAVDSCRNCRILPICSGSCAYKFIYPGSTRGQQGSLPCPSWKYNITERLILRALKMGAIREDDYDIQSCSTDPREICVDETPLAPKVSEAYERSAKTGRVSLQMLTALGE